MLLKQFFSKQIIKNARCLFLSVLFSTVLTLLLIGLAALLMLSGKLTSGMERIFLCVIRIASCFLGGFFAGKKLKTRGFLWGLLVGAVYFCLLIAMRYAAGPVAGQTGGDTMNTVTLLVCCLGSGMLGGMIS